MQHEWVKVTQNNGVLSVCLSRIERKNALNMAMYETLAETLKSAEKDDQVRAVVLSGEGGAFTSGNDLQDFMSNAQIKIGGSPIGEFLWAYATFAKPIVVAVDGVAIGIGTTLLLHSDFAYASPGSIFQLPFTSLGLCPEFASSYLLPRLVGYAKASEWLLLGQKFSADEALTGGLINAVVEQPLEHALKVAEQLAILPPVALRKSKALLKAAQLPMVKNAIASETDAFIALLQGAEFQEAVTAFFNRKNQAPS